MSSHRLAELRSLAYHRALAARIADEPAILARARARVQGWRSEGRIHRAWIDAWAHLLELPLEDLARTLVDPSQRMIDLRQVTPFAGALSSAERWTLWRACRDAS